MKGAEIHIPACESAPSMPLRLSLKGPILLFFQTDASDVDYAMSHVLRVLLHSAMQEKM